MAGPRQARRKSRRRPIAANADEFIGRLPKGYDTQLSERGLNLSGGQKQRIAIARAFLKDAPVLILDEPTSALDTESEALIASALERLMLGRTVFIIAHRFSLIRHVDKIFVLEKRQDRRSWNSRRTFRDPAVFILSYIVSRKEQSTRTSHHEKVVVQAAALRQA